MKPANENLFYYGLFVYSFGIIMSIVVPRGAHEGRIDLSAASAAGQAPVIEAVCSGESVGSERGTIDPHSSSTSAQSAILAERCGPPIKEAVRTIAAPPASRNSQSVGPAGSEQPATIDDASEQSL